MAIDHYGKFPHKTHSYAKTPPCSDCLLFVLYTREKPDTAKLVREVAVALMGGRYVNIPCAGGGSVSSETGWDGRKKDEENEDFRLRCWLHAAKTIKASRYVPKKRKGYGL